MRPGGLPRKGKKKTSRAALGLTVLRCNPDQIVSSTLVRAAQTAEIMRDTLSVESLPETSPYLRPDVPVKETVRWLAEQKVESIMLVGHMPDLSTLASVLISGNAEPRITMKKAAVCAISFSRTLPAEGKGRLEWLMQPRQLRSLADSKHGRSTGM